MPVPLFLAVVLYLSRRTLLALSAEGQSAGGKFSAFGALIVAASSPSLHRLFCSGLSRLLGRGYGLAVSDQRLLRASFVPSLQSVPARLGVGALWLAFVGGLFFVSHFPVPIACLRSRLSFAALCVGQCCVLTLRRL